MKVNHKIVNAETGEETIVEVELTPEQVQAHENLVAEMLKQEEELASKAVARAALLNKLGITEEEAKLLLGGN